MLRACVLPIQAIVSMNLLPVQKVQYIQLMHRLPPGQIQLPEFLFQTIVPEIIPRIL